MKKIVICTANYYTSIYQVGIHHYARAFERLGYRVAFISNPISPLHYLFSDKKSLMEREKIYKNKGIDEGSLWYYVPKSYLTPQNKPFLSSKYIFENWYKFSKTDILEILREKGFDKVDILWIESPFYGFMMDRIQYKKSILRLADYSKGLNRSWRLFYDKEIEIANRVDRVIYTGKNIYEQYSEIKDKDKMLYIPNGIDLNWVENSDKSFPDEFNHIPKPRVIYVGMIGDWFDVELVYKSALSLKKYNFVIIGDCKIELSKLKQLPNVFILGSRPHKDISKYLYHSDVGIIPFKRNEFVDSINPVKIYEYAAYNLKIVTTKWKEIEYLSEYFSICDNDNEFISAITNVNRQQESKIKKWLLQHDWMSKATKAIKFK